MKRRAVPRDNATGFDAMDDTIRGLSSRHGTAPPVEAQLATGNRNLEECVTASAEEYNEINLIVSTDSNIVYVICVRLVQGTRKFIRVLVRPTLLQLT